MDFIKLKLVLLLIGIIEIYSVYEANYWLEMITKPIVTILIIFNFYLEADKEI